MKRIILLAAPAAGKGTQAKLICDKYNLEHISTGDLLRDCLRNEDNFSLKIKEIMESGKLVDDATILELLKRKLNNIDGYVLDGFPRTLAQALSYDALLKEKNENLTHVLYLNVDEEVAKKRIVGRLSCGKCGRVYNELIEENKPKVLNVCDVCLEQLTKRKDDNEEVFKERLRVYNESTKDLIDYYKNKGILHEIDSNVDTSMVFNQIEKVLDGDI